MIVDGLIFYLLIELGLGFHNISDQTSSRILINWLPFFLAWIISASALRQYDPRFVGRRADLWRILPAAALAALLGAVLRSPLTGTPIQLVFVLVMALMIAAGMFAWRFLFARFLAPRLRLNE